MMIGERNTGILFVLSAPSGAGKTTVARAVVDGMEALRFSISYTTRPPRKGERDGLDYHFIDHGRFEAMVEQGAFMEWAEVFGNLYGTGLEATSDILRQGEDLLLDIDIQGAGKVRSAPLESVSVMILPPDYATLVSRLAERGSEGEPERHARLAEALAEAEEYEKFDYLVVNDDLQSTVAAVRAIVAAERSRTSRCVALAEGILATFKSL
jgi:guanylate kinase